MSVSSRDGMSMPYTCQTWEVWFFRLLTSGAREASKIVPPARLIFTNPATRPFAVAVFKLTMQDQWLLLLLGIKG